jgi:hypothetical protein
MTTAQRNRRLTEIRRLIKIDKELRAWHESHGCLERVVEWDNDRIIALERERTRLASRVTSERIMT